MRYSTIDPCECIEGKEWGVSLFTQGCPFHCYGCFNPETWDLNGGEKFTQKTEETILKLIQKPYITRLSILGGEPLVDKNLFELSKLIAKVRQTKSDIKIWVYSGYTYEYLLLRKYAHVKYLDYILSNIDVLVDGQFVQEKKDITLAFCGSSNQRIIDMRQTHEHNIVQLKL